MEYFNQTKQDQRNTERFVILFYSLYTVCLCAGALKDGWRLWIPACLLAAVFAGWAVYFSRYKNYRTRATATSLLIEFSLLLYAAHKDDMYALIPTFMALSVLVAFYGFSKLLWLIFASLLFILFYHGVIHGTFRFASGETLLGLLPQMGNVFCLEFILYRWMKRQNESNSEVYKIIDALMDAEQSKDDFLSNVSHEIRTPVNTICGMSELALREHDSDKLREEVLGIRDAGRNLMTLVSDILDFSQLQQGKMDLEEEPYNITSTINDVINMAMAKKGDKKIELIVDCDADLPSGLLGDEKKIRRVIVNLMDNAIKFTNEGCVSIRVHARRENYGVNLCVTIRDTGIGMSQESLEKLFHSFSQVDTRRNRQEGGVGLGLAISRALVLKMGGTLTVRSRLGKGSILRFVVPQKILEEEPIARVENKEGINAAVYIDMEQFHMSFIRDEYTNNILHMRQQLQIRCHICRNLAELKRREHLECFSHVFISLEEYREDQPYFDGLAKRAKLILVIDRPEEKHLSNPDLLQLYKPFYILPVVSILNGSGGMEGGRQLVRQGRFTAPDAHVLVVDDNRMNIRVIEGLLKEYRIRVTYATSGQEALEVIERMWFDFVFMDHMMPEMDGVETMHRIRSKVGLYYQRIPIVALTANAAPGNREMFLAEGFDDFLAKPVEISVLERVLKRNLPEDKILLPGQSDTETGPQTDGNPETDKMPARDTAADSHPDTVSGGNPPVPEDSLPDIGSLDTRQGILYCGGRKQYLEVLESCLADGEEERRRLEDYFAKQDWKNYTIKVHALKSAMHSIGAIRLAGKAKDLETAGKKGDTEYILMHHGNLLTEHMLLMEELEQCPLLQGTAGKESGTENADTPLPKDTDADLPILDDDTFNRLSEALEDAAYALDGGRMLTVLSGLQEYRYCHVPLRDILEPVKKKVEMSDYMSALDKVSVIRKDIASQSSERSPDVTPDGEAT